MQSAKNDQHKAGTQMVDEKKYDVDFYNLIDLDLLRTPFIEPVQGLENSETPNFDFHKLSRSFEKRDFKRSPIRLKAVIKNMVGEVCFNAFTCNINEHGFGVFGSYINLQKGDLVAIEVSDLENRHRLYATCEISFIRSHPVDKQQSTIGLKIHDIRGSAGVEAMTYFLRISRY